MMIYTVETVTEERCWERSIQVAKIDLIKQDPGEPNDRVVRVMRGDPNGRRDNCT